MTISGKAKGENPIPGTSEPRFGMDHLGFAVDDMDAAVTHLKGNRVKFNCEPWTMPSGTTVAFVEGPDQVSIELIKKSAG
jgi:catechol 2,3-dioxygenase-like lactoylglutathione lyase family enzyme